MIHIDKNSGYFYNDFMLMKVLRSSYLERMIKMEASFHRENRKNLLEAMPDNSAAVLFSGNAPRQSADAYYPFFCSRNFLYLTGVDFAGFILFLQKTKGTAREVLYILPHDLLKERWTGRRPTAKEASAQSGIEDVRYVESFEEDFRRAATGGAFDSLWLDLFNHTPEEEPGEAHRFAHSAAKRYPGLLIRNLLPQLRSQRTIKRPCEIAAMRQAMTVTRAGILAMMKASRPGMYEYEYKAEFDHALTSRGVLTSAFPSIISAGKNNFCIHYYSYTGQAQDGDMILNDVGAWWDNEVNDVSRGWPCNGRFTKEQAALYQCAYNTSEYMFSIIKPGMPMASVDLTARKYCYEQLKAIGKLNSYEEIGKYMWHGGAHHIGYDVHDEVDMTRAVAPGMVFCVDIGIYDEDSGIGFRLEDNCLVTETGCENLSAAIPRKLEDIEDAMAH